MSAQKFDAIFAGCRDIKAFSAENASVHFSQDFALTLAVDSDMVLEVLADLEDLEDSDFLEDQLNVSTVASSGTKVSSVTNQMVKTVIIVVSLGI